MDKKTKEIVVKIRGLFDEEEPSFCQRLEAITLLYSIEINELDNPIVNRLKDDLITVLLTMREIFNVKQ